MGKVCRNNKLLLSILTQQSLLITDRPCLLHSVIVDNFPSALFYHIGLEQASGDVAGNYYYAGEAAGKPYYARDVPPYKIHWSLTLGRWLLNSSINLDNYGWVSVDDTILGDWNPISPQWGYLVATSYGGVNYLSIIDGNSIDGIIKLYLGGFDYIRYVIDFKIPVLFINGIYISMLVSGLDCTIGYELLR